MAEFTNRCFNYAQMERGPVQLNIPRDMFYGDVQVFPINSVLPWSHWDIAGEDSRTDGNRTKRRRPRVDCWGCPPSCRSQSDCFISLSFTCQIIHSSFCRTLSSSLVVVSSWGKVWMLLSNWLRHWRQVHFWHLDSNKTRESFTRGETTIGHTTQ